jgi:hypothetical protein
LGKVSQIIRSHHYWYWYRHWYGGVSFKRRHTQDGNTQKGGQHNAITLTTLYCITLHMRHVCMYVCVCVGIVVREEAIRKNDTPENPFQKSEKDGGVDWATNQVPNNTHTHTHKNRVFCSTLQCSYANILGFCIVIHDDDFSVLFPLFLWWSV